MENGAMKTVENGARFDISHKFFEQEVEYQMFVEK